MSQDFICKMFCVKAWQHSLVTWLRLLIAINVNLLSVLQTYEGQSILSLKTFRGCNDLGASWDSVAMTKMKRDQQISKLQDDHSSEHQLCVIFEAPVWI